MGGAVYESKTDNNAATVDYTDRLQLIAHEEGRIRFKPDNYTLEYDYMLKDHLGNVRMVLTEEQQTIYYPAATLEGTYSPTGAQVNSMVNHEKRFYSIDNTKVTLETSITSWSPPEETVANTKLYYNHNNIPPALPNPNYPIGVVPVQTTGSANLYKLNATSNKTGLEFIIKVMAGDKIDILGKSYFSNTGTVNNANSTLLDLFTLMTSLLTAPANGIGAKGLSASQLTTLNTGMVPSSFFRGANGETTTIPKAYINYIFLDEQFKFAGGSASRVGISGSVKDHWILDPVLQNITAPKNGYIFVYVSNESKLEVFFDNLQVIHKPGPILEETHYYPFGLIQAGISSKAASFGGAENRKKFNGIEHTTDFDLNTYDAFFRNADPQIGRWWQIDPKPNMAESPYSMMGNNPIMNIDPLGDTAVVRWRTGFLGLGKRHEARYVGDQWIDSKTRGNVDISQAKNGAQRLMNDYGGLNNNTAFDKVTDKVNSHSANVVLTDSRKNETDPNSAFRNGAKELKVNLSGGANLRAELNEGNASVRLNSQQVMGHELGHVYDMLSGKPKSHFTTTERGTPIGTYITISNSEINAMYWENILRIQGGLPLRTNYGYTRGGLGGTMLLNNSAIINRNKTYQPISIGDLDGNTFPVQ